jgi:hypothetical protein
MANTSLNPLQELELKLKEVLLHSNTIKDTLSMYNVFASSYNMKVSGFVLIPSIRKALLDDEIFKKQCLCSIAKQFDVNQVKINLYAIKLKTLLFPFSKLSTFGSKTVALKTEN